MRFISKTQSRRLAFLIGCVGLLFVSSSSVWTQEVKKANSGVKELQQQRLAILEQLRDSAKHLFQNARVGFEEVQQSESELLVSRIAYAETKDERIKACDEAIENFVQWQQIVQGRKQAARGTQIDVLKAQAFLLEIQIMREKAANGE